MNAEGWVLRAAEAGEIDRIRAMLREAGLPFEDVAQGRQDLIVALSGGEICGCIGLEKYGRHGLLRSLAVAEEYRGRGTGKALVEIVTAAAREAGIGELYLLTLTADRFFARLGFDSIDRASVPEAIRGTTEFESICPVSSTCMKKKI